MSAMHPLSTGGATPTRSGPARTGPARWAIGIAGAVVAVLAVSYAIFGSAWALGGEDAVSDTLVGYLAGYALIVGMLASLVAFVTAVVARVRHERSALLWLPLALFPALVVIVALVESLWME